MTPSSPALTVIDGGLKEASRVETPEVSSVLMAWRGYQHAKLEQSLAVSRAEQEGQARIQKATHELMRSLLEAHLSDGDDLREELEDEDPQLIAFLNITLGRVL